MHYKSMLLAAILLFIAYGLIRMEFQGTVPRASNFSSFTTVYKTQLNDIKVYDAGNGSVVCVLPLPKTGIVSGPPVYHFDKNGTTLDYVAESGENTSRDNFLARVVTDTNYVGTASELLFKNIESEVKEDAPKPPSEK